MRLTRNMLQRLTVSWRYFELALNTGADLCFTPCVGKSGAHEVFTSQVYAKSEKLLIFSDSVVPSFAAAGTSCTLAQEQREALVAR